MDTLKFKSTYSWQDSVELGASLVILAETLPAHEQTGMVMQLHQLMLDLPAQVAADLSDGSKTRFASIYRLASALELIENIYPALDTAAVRRDFEELVARLESDKFDEAIIVEATAAVADDAPMAEDEKVSPTLEPAKPNADFISSDTFPKPETEVVAVNPIQPEAAQVPVMGAAGVIAPDVTDLPEGIKVNGAATGNFASSSHSVVTQSVNVQPDSLQ